MGRFVIQKHNARALHYDFRLELDGVLKSWAIPKIPPKKAGLKRLAIEVDDHPLSYIDFEGRIEEGSYGSGTVKIWDKGDFEIESRRDYKIVFRLHGKELDGRYTLLKMAPKGRGKNTWLLFKTMAKNSLT